MLTGRPQAIVFDVNETLVDLSRLRLIFDDLKMPPHSLEWWFATLLRDGMALAASGDYGSFASLAGVALDEIMSACGSGTPPGARARILAQFAELDVHPDVAPAFERLAKVGLPILALTNGSERITRDVLERSALTSFVSHVYSVEAVQLWKPRVEAYRYIADEVGLAPQSLAMVAAHPWDLHGAWSAGFITAWVNRHERVFPDVFHPPDFAAGNLVDLTEHLLGSVE